MMFPARISMKKAGRSTSDAPKESQRLGAFGWAFFPMLLIVLSGCLESPTGDPPDAIGDGDGNIGDPIYWEGPISHVDGAPQDAFASGTAAMETATAGTRTGFQIDIEASPGTDDSTMFEWLVRSGSCTDSGDPLAPLDTFGRFHTGDGSFAEVDIRVSTDGLYAAELYSAQGELLGCGNLILQES